MNSKHGLDATPARVDADSEPVATLMSIAAEDHDDSERSDFMGQYYEPWLLELMSGELSKGELGVGFIYSVLGLFAKRHDLDDVTVVLQHDSFGTQMFRLDHQPITLEMAAHLAATPGVYCVPDIVPAVACNAVKTACLLTFSMHLARFSAGRDPLTNIANRRTFDSALEFAAAHSARYEWGFTLVLVDLNNFKAVNDKLGHEFGDSVLRQFGFALRQAVRQGDTAARIGGDEFAVILSNAKGQESSGFTDRLREHLVAAGSFVEFTIGIATSPRDSTNPAELLRIADVQLYKKKGYARP